MALQSPHTFIFIGRSGCGKGTQAKLLQQYLAKIDPKRTTYYGQSGESFREFIKGSSYTQKLSAEIYHAGGLQPEFLAVLMWSKALADNLKEDQHIIFDGSPRKHHEAGVLHSIFDFYKRPHAHVVFIDVSAEWAKKRLMERHRFDDNAEEIKKRLAWYNDEVVPTLAYYKNNPEYTFHTIQGEKSIEDVHKDLIQSLGFTA